MILVGRTIAEVEFHPPADPLLPEDERIKVLYESCMFEPGIWVDLTAVGPNAGPDFIAVIRDGHSKGWIGTVYNHQIEVKHPLEFLASEADE